MVYICISQIIQDVFLQSVIERVAQRVGGLWRLGGVPPVQPGLSLGDTRAPTLSQRSTGISFETTSISSFSVQWISLETFLGICSLRDKLTDSFLESFQFCQQHISIEIIRGLGHHLFIIYYHSNHNLNNFCQIADSNLL